jgi:tetrahydromethanopterin S-methyltransferase subunit G
MADPENIVLEHLRAIRAKLDEIERKVDNLERNKASAAQVVDVELKLSGLTHVSLSGFGSIVNRLDTLDQRVSHLEHERV